MPIETFNIPFESTQNKQQYGTKITCTEIKVKKIKNNNNNKSYGEFIKKKFLLDFGGGSDL